MARDAGLRQSANGNTATPGEDSQGTDSNKGVFEMQGTDAQFVGSFVKALNRTERGDWRAPRRMVWEKDRERMSSVSTSP